MATAVRRAAAASTVVSVAPSLATPSYSVWPGENSPISTSLSASDTSRASIPSGML